MDDKREIRDPVLRQLHANWRSLLPKPQANPWWTMSDMDGWGERNHQFLFIEVKPPGKEFDLTKGQGLGLQRLSLQPAMHCMVWWLTIPDGPVSAIQRLGIDPVPIDVEILDNGRSTAQMAFIDWYTWADDIARTGSPW